MSTTALIAALIELFTELVKLACAAGEDRAKQEDVLMTAQERIAALRAKAKFG